ncbi:MAG: oligopeptide-binding protein oppA [Chlamydiota bacterium]
MRLSLKSILLSALLALAGCQSTLKPSRMERVVHLNINAEPTSLDPRKARDADSTTLLRMVFEGLTRIGRDGNAEPGLADRIDVSSDGLWYTFHLRPSKWSDGDSLTAFDFVDSWKTILSPEFPSDIAFQLFVLKHAREIKQGQLSADLLGAKALDAETLVIELEHPVPYFLELLTMPYFGPTKKGAADNWATDAEQYVCNGPFSVTAWSHRNCLTLKKNPHYWESEGVKMEGLEIQIATNDTALRMFEEGKLDYTGSPLSALPADAVAVLKGDRRIKTSPFLATFFFRINTAHGQLANASLRKALSYAIDRHALVEHVLQGGQTEARGLVPPEMGLNPGGCFGLENSKAWIQQAEEELGHPIEPITLSYYNNERSSSIALVVQKCWQDTLGLSVTLEGIEPKVYFDRVSKGAYQITGGSWTADFNDPINFLEVFKDRQCGTNNTGWENKRYVDLLKRCSLCTNRDERFELMRQAELVLMDDMPIIPLYHGVLNYMVQEGLKGVAVSPLGQLDFRWAYRIEDECAR